MFGTILIVILILMLMGTLPTCKQQKLGYGPSGGLGLVVIILVVLLLMDGSDHPGGESESESSRPDRERQTIAAQSCDYLRGSRVSELPFRDQSSLDVLGRL